MANFDKGKAMSARKDQIAVMRAYRFVNLSTHKGNRGTTIYRQLPCQHKHNTIVHHTMDTIHKA